MFTPRNDEPGYAFLRHEESGRKNRYGKNIETTAPDSPLRGSSMNINGNDFISDYSDRYKQHGFHFTADNCIACHACEAACSEKNDNPPHIAFRAVGFIEGGSYPDYARINISMACNHCDDPVCLKGCPTRAYTKFAEYGAVLQDPDICFGCGYCTWLCPYNAPQLDPVKGQVSKCNMCVDRLEAGLKPACVAACLGNALDFGIIENIPENRVQTKAQIPGFPAPEITHPNIRFQLSRSLQRAFTRPDGTAIKYMRENTGFKSAADETGVENKRRWSLKPLLSSHENAHIIFTLGTQAVMGAFALLALGSWLDPASDIIGKGVFVPLMLVLLGVQSFAMMRLNLHLGKPLRFYRGFNNWRLSPVSREIAGVSLFFIGLGAYALAGFAGPGYFALIGDDMMRLMANIATMITLAGGATGLFYMIKLYLIPARSYWNHWQSASSFTGTALTLGASLLLAVNMLFAGCLQTGILAYAALAGLALEATGLIFHARHLKSGTGEAHASHFEQTRRYGKIYILRNILLGFNIAGFALIAILNMPSAVVIILICTTLAAAIIGRALFYVCVVPSTMPGAFFWRSRAFAEQVKNSGLCKRTKTGIA